ncbi:MAG: peptidoglycan DL-endopeptidase CwlO [Mycobacterium sp.]|jgi:cell wall-associated NlpC family hydrolase|nr:peptidoglycan DL-endopeptidase CwlO [Mycobacterium sp.]
MAAMAAVSLAASIVTGIGHADPVADALARLNDLSRQAEQTTEEMHTAQVDLDKKLAVQKVADDKHAADQAAADSAKTELATYQGVVDKLAAAMYMGGRTDGLSAIMTATSPQNLIDQMTAQASVASEMAAQMASYRAVSKKTAAAEAASSKSASDARTAAEQAAAVRADVQAKQSKLQVQIAIVKSQYLALTPAQRSTLAGPGVPPPATLPDAPEALPNDLPPPPEVDINAMGPSPDAAIPPGDMAEPHMPGGGPEGTVVVQAALSRIGSPYSWGASGPNAFDCSGLVMWAYQQAGMSLPHSSQALARGGQPVDLSQMQPGDVVTYYGDASHVAIYIGDGMMVHASTYGTPVRVAPVGNAPIYNVRRY